jgi:hypothetical protein
MGCTAILSVEDMDMRKVFLKRYTRFEDDEDPTRRISSKISPHIVSFFRLKLKHVYWTR